MTNLANVRHHAAVPLLSGLAGDAKCIANLRPRRTRLAEAVDRPADLLMDVGERGAEVAELLGPCGLGGSVEAVSSEVRGVSRHVSMIVDGVPACQEVLHYWLDRPESDTRECLICGTEVSG